MKKQHLFPSLILINVFALFSCGQENEATLTANETEKTLVEEVINSNYQLDATNSKADWERTLDQKPTKQKVKLFGSMVDVELGAVKLNTNGTIAVNNGELNTTNDDVVDATVIFDMASLKFAQEKGSGLFDAKQYPNSTLTLTNFKADSAGYLAEGTLTIQKVSKSVTVVLEIIKTDKNYSLKGSFTINTLDFPLRDKVTEKDINKDEIKILFELNYIFKS
ncbi:MAG: hypothetical protein COX70_01465 [Flavobacteriales bacterium CG_4_10_14_0_2_um_filter_32_8]|nr:MAG: hypothetical protein COX70_01465 [Flavobacteriales bacterium CG_4_10_14_0_2_um_filter_32_8]PJB15709.1 MAG: hypothetical protein CO118_02455 [Flavobacteriales bacterium CG_4_9_14_3_um_filter_32_8]